MRRFLILVSLTLNSLFAAAHADELKCLLRYQVPGEDGQVKYVAPKNGDVAVKVLDIKFCNENGCQIRKVASAFLGSGIGGASVRINGEQTTVILRDAHRHRSAASFNTGGLIPTRDGAALFTLNAEGVYNDEAFNAVLFACGLYQ